MISSNDVDRIIEMTKAEIEFLIKDHKSLLSKKVLSNSTRRHIQEELDYAMLVLEKRKNEM